MGAHTFRGGLLVVDDEEGVRLSIARALRKEPYQIHGATNADEALRFLEERGDELVIIITDYKMPGMNGLDFLARVAEINPEIVRILLTGYANLTMAIEANNMGVDGILTKPFKNEELRQKVRDYYINNRMRRFVTPAILTRLKENPTLTLPSRQCLTVLIANVKGFSDLAAECQPEEMATILSNFYFSPLSKVALAHCGTIDKHVGDRLMILFGAPIYHPDHAFRAVHSGLKMQERMAQLNASLAEKGFTLPVGIGVATGEVLVGMFGSAYKREYTALGRVVERAEELVERALPGRVVIDEGTKALLGGRLPLSPLRLVGHGQMTAYEVLAGNIADPMRTPA